MISIPQIRAARALLGWKQEDIARASGLSLTTLNYIEKETVSPRQKTMTIVQQAFEDAGVEFLPGDGLRLRSETFNVQSFAGKEGIRHMLEDAIATQKKYREGAVWFGVSEDQMIKNHRQDYFAYFLQLKELKITERVVTMEQQRNFYGPSSMTEYRVLARDFLGGIDYGIYGNKMCFTTFEKRPRLVVIENDGIANGFKLQFEAFWRMARPAKPYESGFEKDFKKYGVPKQ